MTTMQDHSTVAIYPSHLQAESAIKALQATGFDMRKLSIVGTHFQTQEHAIGFYNTGDRMQFWGANGAFWGGLWGSLFGSALFFIPIVGPLFVLGPLVGWIAGALEGAAIGGSVGILGAALVGAGVPENSVVSYETEVKAGSFLVLAHGTADEIERARSILRNGASRVDAHPPAARPS